jgi:pimeloyl-ACP methyl ester carboxylesterase
MKRFVIFMLTMSLVSLSCQTVYNLANPNTEPTNEVPSNPEATTIPSTASPSPNKITDIRDKLNELGGKPCAEASDFTCVTLKVPLNHLDPANTETIDVVFAVAPATGERYGMYVQAFPGGPGGEGIPYASTFYFPPDIPDHYDIVFFDQRGVGLSNPLQCKNAYAKYFLDYMNADDTAGNEGYDTPQEQQAAEQEAKSFDEECVAEIGIDPAKLKFFTTDQVAEDIESFRQAIGDDKFMLYGVSYGTSVAQAYARAHADHLSGLILDGTQDTTLSGDQVAFSQWEAANMVLEEVFKACDAESACSRGMGGSSQAAYDELAQKLAKGAIPYNYPVSGGKTVKRLFTTHMLDFATAYQLYGLDSRFDLMRAIADAKKGNLVPLAELYYSNSNVDPATDQYLGDPNFSDTMYYVVWCSDDAYYNGTPQERADKLMQEGQKLNGVVPRLDLDVMPLGLACTYLPSAPASEVPLEPLKAPGVPTFVLNATLDPATPFHEGKSVFQHLENGYHIYVNGGLHSIYGRGQNCPDQYVDDFLLKGTLPDQREIVCDWPNAVLGK